MQFLYHLLKTNSYHTLTLLVTSDNIHLNLKRQRTTQLFQISETQLHQHTASIHGNKKLVGKLNLFNTESSPKRYWLRPRSQEVREEGNYT